VALELAAPDTRYLRKCGEREGAAAGHLAQRQIMKYDVRWKLLTARLGEAPGAQRIPDRLRGRVEAFRAHPGFRIGPGTSRVAPAVTALIAAELHCSGAAQNFGRARRQRETTLTGDVRQNKPLRYQLAENGKPAAAVEFGTHPKGLQPIMPEFEDALGFGAE